MNKNLQFLLVLYSVTSPTPMFFQVTSDVSGKLKFGLLYAEVKKYIPFIEIFCVCLLH